MSDEREQEVSEGDSEARIVGDYAMTGEGTPVEGYRTVDADGYPIDTDEDIRTCGSVRGAGHHRPGQRQGRAYFHDGEGS